ncbi:beta-ketoacyl-[acyl-carrier-protein] synthase family protein [Geoalkalibacter halelectricus]|uniref:Beta-ketoacyl-[acyl-carrier-protein] synthase family protein n=1 Tax=Geoalkalibacter halelectricus TaxID=2847045 RepID=A0ABY5ZKL9_9BACT|nr:beta-ketoacyl synthase N-terminal-like domain-containing protein [Geoalkalibacter halelectricus]MDO3379807.1 beta-ketoacyl-[acyl-carrier-protein] synthase family protein [Geoalkalibacter halelectricus]UWZ79241.1 beta-ketoacyl-[acyl-carrier-protein] synthase family protein [Geoalkalibacter halelectricus]
MPLKRVVITGMGAVSPFGRNMEAFVAGLIEGRSAVGNVPEMGRVGGMRTQVAALVTGIDPKEIPRKHRRSMSPMSIFATLACGEALAQSGIAPEQASDGRLGLAIGSTVGSTQAIENFFRDFFVDHSLERMKSTLFFQIMNHSVAANVAQALNITGRLLAPASACSTGCQAIGYGYEMIACGRQDMMLCGGADEFHPLTAATFDVLNAASVAFNDRPAMTPRPFDLERDGVVCAEGAGVVLMESLDSALARGAEILGEVAGFGTVSDPSNIANPNSEAIERCMRLALDDAGLRPDQVDYLNAHATATLQGDIAESEAIGRLFGSRLPVSSFKGHIGHAMAASGSLELIAALELMRRGLLVPTRNLDRIDPACGSIHHVTRLEEAATDIFVKNNFALGGVNSSIVIRRYRND